MIQITNNAIVVFGFSIYFYGLVIMLGVLLATFLAGFQAKRRGLSHEFLWDVLFWLLIGGIIGARLWHIFTPPPSMIAQGITTEYYLTHPLRALNIRSGGMGIPGAVLGGMITLYFLTRKKGEDFLIWTDLLAPSVALGQAVGRWGNYFNQELYGSPTSLPWGIYIDEAHRLPEFIDQAIYHPLFFYEFVLNLINMAVLLWVGRRFAGKLIKGDIMLGYLMGYSAIRFSLDFLRLDNAQIVGLNANQTVMVVVFFLALGFIIFRHLSKKPTPEKSE
ncbi:MAG: prolipoprotein diacylglyceryl transferase [Anaerolineales bacterium]|nr:prolipoprotein diacylglyceryl transferase [Anaerolineales bacterium]